jgi:hypothetical protein
VPSYILRKVSATVWTIRHERRQVGTVTQYGSRYTGVLTHATKRIERTSEVDANTAFRECVRAANQIDMCGTDDPAKAREALAQRNEATAQANADFHKLLGPELAMLADRFGIRPRVRRRRILI